MAQSPIGFSEPENNSKSKDGETSEKQETGGHHGGLNVWQTAFFILGEVAGSGVLSLPYAVLEAGKYFNCVPI